ncbi:acetate--CoA ligase [Cryptosporangium aurantiacum]|uniref:Acetyl-coenzyme A synthetase n=1 Tax=Cryptosporangium aurantiacum TaxID=134849 RepID=A0A1M7R454_9ACTN|nr:acetate--CoA ligase [Cryptosporangium aurantiacum]SHN39689.1 acetyl-coenzyme A synthetase [Cryptosporangium aurantiacum]
MDTASTERFLPPDTLRSTANLTAAAFDEAADDRLAFWARQADRLHWDAPFRQVLDWSDAPFARWFVDGRLNVAYNCVDRHVENGHGDRVALRFVGEPGDEQAITYRDLQEQVSRAADALERRGVRAGDPVAIYLPMIPEAVVAMLACARIGAPHTVVFGGFSADALSSRILDFRARTVITADGGFRRGAPSALKPAVDAALEKCPDVTTVLVVRRTGQDIGWVEDRDEWWHDALAGASAKHTPQSFDSEQPLFVMYTSGTTGKPKGILHTSGGYLTQAAYTFWGVFDHQPDDVYWCTADVGWITGHSYLVYGPLAVGATQVIYEGTPDTPHRGRWWEIIERHRVTLFYTAPTAIRTCMKWGDDLPARYDLSSLRILGTVGESINPEAYRWYRRNIGGDRTPIVDTWWQTETGAHMLSPLPGVTAAKPGAAMGPIPGISADVVDDDGNPVLPGESGYLVLTEPWPAMVRTIWGDPDRFRETYWSRWPGYYFAGDGARRDLDGDIWLLGRVDDVMNVSGHRLSTVEIESALVSHPRVAEAAVVGAADDTTGQAVVAYVILREAAGRDEPDLAEELRRHVAVEIGPIAKPRHILLVPELPKTRSGKIMRRLLRDVAENREVGDATTLADAGVMDQIRSGMAAARPEDD